MLRNLTLFVCAFTIFGFCAQPAHGTSLTATLTCVLEGPTSVSCNPASNYGSVTLGEPDVNGDIQLTVNVQNIAGKFRDLMLNFNGSGITSVVSDDGQAFLSPNGFSLPPYVGLFDIGATDQENWNSTSALYTVKLIGSGDLALTMFDLKDSLGNLNVALQLQDLATTGESLKVGGIWGDEGGPPQEIPEPATTALLGGGLIALAWALRRRKG
jgi:hypothetical protein